MIVIEILFWLSLYLIAHSYVVFPMLLKVLASNKTLQTKAYRLNDSLPRVAIIVPAHNEELVIANKIESIFNTAYPLDLISVYIGSDNSTDATNAIVQEYLEKYTNLHFVAYTERQGKPMIINNLCNESTADVFILTDANVYFEPQTIFELVKHCKDESVGLIGGLILNTNLKKHGISMQETAYLSLENSIKYQEGLLWGAMIGAFGGVFAIKKECFVNIPANFIVDDFYITMKVLEQKKKAILEPLAISYEDVANSITEEFRRKVRISVGNFQNLIEFRKLAYAIFSPISFCFVSHKILRWFTPFFIIFSFLCASILAIESYIYAFFVIMQIVSFLVVGIDVLLQKKNIHNKYLRFIHHFYSMNIALLLGFFKFIKGVKSNVWQPTKRYQN